MALTNTQHVTNWRNRIKSWLEQAFGGKCGICGYDKCSRSLEFHHLDPTQKDFGFHRVRANPKNWAIVIAEIRKCVMLCANCHREVHAGITNVPEDIRRFNEAYAIRPVYRIDKAAASAASKRAGYAWQDVNLSSLLQVHGSPEKVAKSLGISGAAVRKRMAKELKQLDQ